MTESKLPFRTARELMDTDANERMALLLGWTYVRKVVEAAPEWTLMKRPDGTLAGLKDYTTWERFPEMQEYVRDVMTAAQRIELAQRHLLTPHSNPRLAKVWLIETVTPTILRDAILETVPA